MQKFGRGSTLWSSGQMRACVRVCMCVCQQARVSLFCLLTHYVYLNESNYKIIWILYVVSFPLHKTEFIHLWGYNVTQNYRKHFQIKTLYLHYTFDKGDQLHTFYSRHFIYKFSDLSYLFFYHNSKDHDPDDIICYIIDVMLLSRYEFFYPNQTTIYHLLN